jgi:hypothetical protein
MPPVHGSKAKLLLSGYDVSTSMQDATAGLSVDSADASTWGTTNKRYAVSNIIDGTFTGSGVWEATGATPGSIDELLHTKLAGNHVATYMPAGDGFGNRARLIGGYETSFDIPSPTDDIVAFEFEIQSSAGFLHKARVLRPVGADNSINGNSNGTALDGPSHICRGDGRPGGPVSRGSGDGPALPSSVMDRNRRHVGYPRRGGT